MPSVCTLQSNIKRTCQEKPLDCAIGLAVVVHALVVSSVARKEEAQESMNVDQLSSCHVRSSVVPAVSRTMSTSDACRPAAATRD